MAAGVVPLACAAISTVVPLSAPRPRGLAPLECSGIVERGRRGRRRAARISAQRAQADLHHIGVVDRYAAAISIICNVIQGQDEAVVDIADADLGLADLVGMQVISRRTEQDPVWMHLQPGAAEHALAAVE